MEQQQAAVLWCPRCLAAVGEAARCPACGLRQQGTDAARLRVVVRRLYELGEAQRELAAEAAPLRAEQARLLASLDPQAAAADGAAAAGRSRAVRSASGGPAWSAGSCWGSGPCWWRWRR